MMKTLWTATAVMAFVTVLLFVLIKSPVPGIISAVFTFAALCMTLYMQRCRKLFDFKGGGERFYASMSIVIPDLNSTVKWSAKTVIFSMSSFCSPSTDREMTTPLLLLRAVQLGIHISEMDLLTIGTVLDMYTELQRDDEPHDQLASQDDMDRF